jgi:predicted nucleic acid-binding protein
VSLLLDTGIVYAYYDRSDDWHARAHTLLRTEPHGLILPAPVIPEIDHLLGARLGDRSRLTFYSGITGGHFLVAEFPRQLYGRVADVNKQFADLSLGFVDAAVAILADTLDVRRVATTDRRHFTPLAAHFSLELVP